MTAPRPKAVSTLSESFLARVDAAFPAGILSFDPDDLVVYGKDWTKEHDPAPCAVAFPKSTSDVSTLLALANEYGVRVVPSGGRTGLAGGAVAAQGELVVTMTRMRRMDPVDVLGGTVRVQAGAVTAAVHEHCAAHGLTWPVDFASKGSSHVGGNIATNAGGVKVIRYGLTRHWVLGLEVVLANGQILALNGALEKNNTGTDLRQLFIGSEGTLGVITEATLKLTRLPDKLDVFLFTVEDLSAVLRLFREVRKSPFVVSAYEFFTDRCLARVIRHGKHRSPFAESASHYVLVEFEGGDASALETFCASLFERGLVREGVGAQHASQAAELWALRENISESLSATGRPHKNDIALPIATLEDFCGELSTFFAQSYPEFEICLFGHIGDGNLHVNVMKPDAMDLKEFVSRTAQADHAVFKLVQKYGGSVSAEHGIGLLKKDYLSYTRTPPELTVLRALKRTLDPKNILNPGKIFDGI